MLLIDCIAQWLDVAEKKYADRIALICENDMKITYNDLISQSTEMAKSLRKVGIRSGDHIGVWLANSPEWVILEIACGMLGAVLVGLNTRYRVHELAYMIRHSDCKIFFFGHCSNEMEETLQEMMPELFESEKATNFEQFPLLEKVVFIGTNGPQGAWNLKEFSNDFIPINNQVLFYSDKTQPLNILFTSGTTTSPKGAVLNQQTVLAHSFNTAEKMKITEQDISMVALPFCGIFGLNALWQSLVKGASIVIIDRFNINEVCKKIEFYRCTVWHAVDQMYMKLIEYQQVAKVDLSSLRIGGAGMFIFDGLDIIKKVEKETPYLIMHTYGMTEVGSMLLLGEQTRSQEERAISGGHLVSGELKIINPDTLEETPNGVVGEMIISGINVMDGYYKRKEENEKSFIFNHFFRTGDLGCKYADGTVEYHGRLKEAMRLSGFLVSPSEIENFLTEINGIRLAQVIGLQAEQETVVVAFIILEKNKNLSIHNIRKQCGKLAHFKRPNHIFMVEDFPKSYGSNGEKIRRDLLIKLAQEKIQQIK